MDKKLANAFKNKEIIKFDNLIDISATWDNFIELINYGYKVPREWDFTPEQQELFLAIGDIKFYDKLTMMISQVHYSNLKEVKDLVEKVLTPNGITLRAAAAAVSFTDCEKTTRRHSDQVNVLYVQCIGRVRWEVWLDDIKQEYILNPGDAIFVPLKIYHEVISLTPRAGITFAIDLD